MPGCASWAETGVADALYGGALDLAAADLAASADERLAVAARAVHRHQPAGVVERGAPFERDRHTPERARLDLDLRPMGLGLVAQLVEQASI